MSEQKVESKYIDKDPPMGTEQQLEKKNNDYLAYLKEKLNFILATYGRRLTDADGHVNELIRTAAEFAVILSQKVGDDEIISKINQSPEQITISANRINLVGTTIVNGKLVSTYTKTFNHSDYSQADISIISSLVTNRNWTASDLDKYDINMDGELSLSDLIKVRNMVLNGTDETATIKCEIDPSKSSFPVAVYVNNASEPKTYLNGTQMVSQAGTFKHLKADDFSGSSGLFRLDSYGLSFYDSNGNTIASYPSSGLSGIVVEEGEIIVSETITEVDCSASVNVNTKWFYRKYGNGDYECWTTIKYGASDLGQFTAGTSANPQTWSFAEGGGKLYLRTLPALQYPVTFDEVPHEVVSIAGCSSSESAYYGGAYWLMPFGLGTGNTKTRTGKFEAVRPTNFTNGLVYTIRVKGKVSS